MCPGGYRIRPYVCAASLRASNARPYKGDFITKNPVSFFGHRIF